MSESLVRQVGGGTNEADGHGDAAITGLTHDCGCWVGEARASEGKDGFSLA